jgi:hypothetical protein
MNMRDKIARAIWETWRKSQHASDEASLLTWEELSTADADSYPGLAELTELAFAESDAVLDAMREPSEELLMAAVRAGADAQGYQLETATLKDIEDAKLVANVLFQAMIDAAKEQR